MAAQLHLKLSFLSGNCEGAVDFADDAGSTNFFSTAAAGLWYRGGQANHVMGKAGVRRTAILRLFLHGGHFCWFAGKNWPL